MNGNSKRPSPKELNNKLCQAAALFNEGKWTVTDIRVFRKDCRELDLLTKSERLCALEEIFSSLVPDNYKGKRPPEVSYEKEIKGKELFVFRIFCESIREEVYVKFAFKNGILYIVSFHKNRESSN